jgi:hypothetical protein
LKFRHEETPDTKPGGAQIVARSQSPLQFLDARL